MTRDPVPDPAGRPFLARRAVLGQAVGVLMVRSGVTSQVASARLWAIAEETGVDVEQVATDIVASCMPH